MHFIDFILVYLIANFYRVNTDFSLLITYFFMLICLIWGKKKEEKSELSASLFQVLIYP
jgi:hypothetical protein